MIEPAVRLFEDIERERRELNHIQDPDQAKESAHRAAGADPNKTSSYAQKILNISNALERVHYK